MKKLLLLSILFFTSYFASAQEVTLELFQSGFAAPLDIQNAQDERLFVAELGGRIKILYPDGTINQLPFLNISGLISNGNEQGLLGFAFHPDYANNGYFFVNYTNINGDTQISRFSVSAGDPDLADPNSELPIIGYAQPFPTHNGGSIAFGPDGYLYITSGDGGSGGDPDNRAQNTLVPLGKILRLDVDNPNGGKNYGIPPDNPFVGNPNGMDEIWAYGLRNPWRISFDFTENHIWIGDVGQSDVEEVNRQLANSAGLNYGWRCYEGSVPFNTSNCPPIGDLTFPIVEYSSSAGSGNCSVTGGYVYRGSVYTDIAGLYFFADYCSGLIWTLDENGNLIEHGNFAGNWVSFGQDVNQELYALSVGGDIYKIKGGVTAGTENFSFKNSLTMLPNPATESISFISKENQLERILLFDTQGRLVLTAENISAKTKVLSISNLTEGIYFAKITSEKGQSSVKKLIIQ